MTPEPVIVSWSGGKDSALLVDRLRHDPSVRIAGLVTTVTRDYGRISMHGVRREILRAQAESLEIRLVEAPIPAGASNADFESAFAAALEQSRQQYGGEISRVAFGDLFLRDVRAYREEFMERIGWRPLFPLWEEPTPELARRFVREGFRAIVCCVDTEQLSADFAGCEYDSAFLDSLPTKTDPCGENGEFHTCVYAGPIFQRQLSLTRGERVRRDGRFEYCDLTAALD